MKQTIPYWHELPDLDLYLDQVLLYVNQTTTSSELLEQKSLTASMINNYVKHKQLENLLRKISKTASCPLDCLDYLKNVFSIQEISQTLNLLLHSNNSETLYNHFVDCMRNEESDETPEIIRYACQSVKLYYKTRQLTMELERSHYES